MTILWYILSLPVSGTILGIFFACQIWHLCIGKPSSSPFLGLNEPQRICEMFLSEAAGEFLWEITWSYWKSKIKTYLNKLVTVTSNYTIASYVYAGTTRSSLPVKPADRDVGLWIKSLQKASISWILAMFCSSRTKSLPIIRQSCTKNNECQQI